MKHSLTIAFVVAAALGSGGVLAQDKAAAAKTAAKSTQATQATQVAQAGGVSPGATMATAAPTTFGSAVVSSLPFIGITAGMSAVASSASGETTGATTHH